jgi:hypothetical protein
MIRRIEGGLGQGGKSLIVGLLVMAVCVVAIVSFQLPQLRQLENQENISVAEVSRAVEAERAQLQVLQQMPAFGFDNLLSDWAFLRFLQYFGDDVARSKTDYRLSPDYFEVVIGRNPYFLPAYTFLSTSTSIYAGQPERTIAIAQKGIESLGPDRPPGSFYALRQLGIDQLLFMNDAAGARRSFEMAAEWARASTAEGSDRVADLSEQTAEFLANNPDSKFAQIAAWSMVLTTAPDQRTRETAAERIEAIGGQIVLQEDGTFSIIPPDQD